MWPLARFSADEVLSVPGTLKEAERKEWLDFWERMVGFHRHEDGLLNARFQAFAVATAFMMAATSQFREKQFLYVAWALCIAGLALAAVAYRILGRTARTIEWYLDALGRLDRVLFPSNQQLYAARTRHLGELQTRGRPSLPPVSVILGTWVPAGVAVMWVAVALLLGLLHLGSIGPDNNQMQRTRPAQATEPRR